MSDAQQKKDLFIGMDFGKNDETVLCLRMGKDIYYIREPMASVLYDMLITDRVL